MALFSRVGYATCIALFSFSFAHAHFTRYQEMFGPTGELRPHYAEFVSQTGFDYFEPDPQFESAWSFSPQRGGPLGDSIQVLPRPVLLTSEENEKLKRAVVQRARALTAFFADIAIGKQKAVDRILPYLTIQSMLDKENLSLDSLREIWAGKKASDIRFFYAPDIARGPSGEFVVIEDNTGIIGGIADKDELLKKLSKELGFNFFPRGFESYDFGRFVVSHARSVPAKGRKPWVLALIKPKDERTANLAKTDFEANRLKNILQKALLRAGIEPVVTPALNAEQKYSEYIQKFGEPLSILNWDELGQDEMSAYEMRLWLYYRVFRKNGTPLMVGPGTPILGNKILSTVMDRMIEFYLREKPIIKTQPTMLVEKGWMPADNNWVIKGVSSAGGAQVDVLPHLSEEERMNVRMKLKRTFPLLTFKVLPDRYVAQPYLPFSTISANSLDYQVDFRPVAYVNGDKDIIVGRTIFGRAAPVKGPGKNNITAGALEVPVVVSGGSDGFLIRPTVEQTCEAALEEAD